MTRQVALNRSAAILEKGGVWVIFLNYNFLFFEAQAADFLARLLAGLKAQTIPADVPDDFIAYLVQKGILKEAR
jgi:hypothetical protein